MRAKNSVGYHCYHLWLTFTGYDQCQKNNKNQDMLHNYISIRLVEIISRFEMTI